MRASSWIVALSLAGCGKHDVPAPAAGSATADPWAATGGAARPIPGISPAETHALALAVCPKVEHPTYFTIEKDGKVSHALGTRHFGVGVDRFPQGLVDELKRSKVAVFETAPGDNGAVADQPVDLKAALGPQAWQHLRELAGDDRASQLASAAPVYAALVVPTLYEDLTAQLDDELGTIAKDANIPTRGLETSLFQDQLLHELFTTTVARSIISAVKDRAELKADTTNELGDYCKGNPGSGGIDDETRRYFKAAGYDDARLAALEERLVFARTAAWVPKLQPLLDSGGAFVAVGADHLVGAKGLVAELQAAGYTVTPAAP